MVMIPPPSLDDGACLGHRRGPGQVEAWVPQAAVEGRDEGTIGRLARPGTIALGAVMAATAKPFRPNRWTTGRAPNFCPQLG